MKFKMTEGGYTTELPYGQLDVSGNEEFGFRPYQLLVSTAFKGSMDIRSKARSNAYGPTTEISFFHIIYPPCF